MEQKSKASLDTSLQCTEAALNSISAQCTIAYSINVERTQHSDEDGKFCRQKVHIIILLGYQELHSYYSYKNCLGILNDHRWPEIQFYVSSKTWHLQHSSCLVLIQKAECHLLNHPQHFIQHLNFTWPLPNPDQTLLSFRDNKITSLSHFVYCSLEFPGRSQ